MDTVDIIGRINTLQARSDEEASDFSTNMLAGDERAQRQVVRWTPECPLQPHRRSRPPAVGRSPVFSRRPESGGPERRALPGAQRRSRRPPPQPTRRCRGPGGPPVPEPYHPDGNPGVLGSSTVRSDGVLLQASSVLFQQRRQTVALLWRRTSDRVRRSRDRSRPIDQFRAYATSMSSASGRPACARAMSLPRTGHAGWSEESLEVVLSERAPSRSRGTAAGPRGTSCPAGRGELRQRVEARATAASGHWGYHVA